VIGMKGRVDAKAKDDANKEIVWSGSHTLGRNIFNLVCLVFCLNFFVL